MNVITRIEFENLFDNCIYSSIAHAIFVLKEPFFSYTQSWDDYNYSFNYGSTRGTISFYSDSNIAVGAARDEQSERRKLYPQHDAIEFFNEASDYIRKMALQDSLEYLFDEEKNVVKPIASIGFWLENGCVMSADNTNIFKVNGGEYIFIISQKFNELKEIWQEQYDLSADELSVIDYIYQCWKSNKQLNNKMIKGIINKKREGYIECLESLKEIGVSID